jgi:RNA polymerase sigma factor (sigma-70 family)
MTDSTHRIDDRRPTDRTTALMDDTTDDAALIDLALRGDRDAMARIYDRHADRVHDMCVHMLGDRDEAADVTGEVFLVAMQRLSQLRRPERLRAWLFAIARHEVYRRTRRRSRVQLTQETDDMDRIATAADARERDEPGPDPAQLATLLRDASTGLDERDRMVMELQLQGLDGDELAAALGTSVSTGYQQVHRMKERLGRSLGAVMVARHGRADCEVLDRLLADWDGSFSVLWRKRVARHVDACDVCDERRRAVPAALFGGAALAVPMVPAGAVSAAPASVRARVLAGADAPAASSRGRWLADGFPPGDGGSPRRTALIVAAIALAMLLVVLLSLWWPTGGGQDEIELLSGAGSSTTTSTTDPSGTGSPAPTSTTVVVPTAPIAPSPVPSTIVSPAAPATTAPLPASPLPPPPPVDPLPTPPVGGAGPDVELTAAPSTVFRPTVGTDDCGASEPVVAVAAQGAVRVELWWGRDGQVEGIVQLQRVGPDWRGVLEVPASVSGTVTMLAVAVDAQDRAGVSDTRPAVVAPCPTPG